MPARTLRVRAGIQDDLGHVVEPGYLAHGEAVRAGISSPQAVPMRAKP